MMESTQRRSGQKEGKFFEQAFERQARSNGLFPLKNDLSAQYVQGGRILIKKSDLDFRVLAKGGNIAYIDCKTFADKRVQRSELNDDQAIRADLYSEWGLVSGFVVWLREINKVVFFDGSKVLRTQRGMSLGPDDGIVLGSIERFDVRLIFRQPSVHRPPAMPQ